MNTRQGNPSQLIGNFVMKLSFALVCMSWSRLQSGCTKKQSVVIKQPTVTPSKGKPNLQYRQILQYCNYKDEN